MSYSNGLLHFKSEGVVTGKGKRGEPGVGFKPTVDGNYDMENKKLTNIDEGASSSDAVNKHQLETALNDKHDNTGNIDLKDAYNIINSKPQTVAELVKHYDNLISYRDGREVFVSRNDSLEMKADLDLGKHFIYNVKKAINDDQAVNKEQMDSELNKKLSSVEAGKVYLRQDGSKKMTGNLDMDSGRIERVATGRSGQYDAMTVKQFEDEYFKYNAGTSSLNAQFPIKMDADPNIGAMKITGLASATSDTDAVNKKYADDNFFKKDNSGSLNMNQKYIYNVHEPGSGRNDVVTRGYADTRYFQKNTDLNLNNKKITNLATGTADTDAVNKKQLVDASIAVAAAIDSEGFLKKDGSIAMTGNLDMNEKQIIKLKDPTETTDADNKQYVDKKIIKTNVKPSRTLNNVFQYLMNDVDEWSTEYNVEVDKIDAWEQSPHYWDKKVLYIKPIKKDGNYRYRLGLQLYSVPNGEYTIAIESFFTDSKLQDKASIYMNGVSVYVESYETKKYSFDAGTTSNIWIYYTRTIVNFRKGGSPPIYLYYTVHIDKDGTDLDTYPERYSWVYTVAYGIRGNHSNVESNVYDAHKAFEIDKTKMKMLVPLDMNNQRILNFDFNKHITHLIHGFLNLDATASNKKFSLNGSKELIFPKNVIITKIRAKISLSENYPRLTLEYSDHFLKIHSEGQQNPYLLSSTTNTRYQTINTNIEISDQGLFSIVLINTNIINKDISLVISYKFK